MYIDNDLYERINNITRTSYTQDFGEENVWVDGDKLYVLIEDLVCEVEHLKAKIQYIEQDKEENWKKIDAASQYNISENWFR